jgi:hypothetical protein
MLESYMKQYISSSAAVLKKKKEDVLIDRGK